MRNICVVSASWLFWVMTLWVFMAKSFVNQLSVPLGIYLGKRLLSHTVTMLNSLRNCQTFLKRLTAPFYIPTSNVWGFHFLHILVDGCSWLFYYTYSHECEVVFHRAFDLHFLNGWGQWASFPVLMGHLYNVLWKNLLTFLLTWEYSTAESVFLTYGMYLRAGALSSSFSIPNTESSALWGLDGKDRLWDWKNKMVQERMPASWVAKKKGFHCAGVVGFECNLKLFHFGFLPTTLFWKLFTVVTIQGNRDTGDRYGAARTNQD